MSGFRPPAPPSPIGPDGLKTPPPFVSPKTQSFFDRMLSDLAQCRREQDDIITLRLQVLERRKALSLKRQEIADCDAKLMNGIRAHWAKSAEEQNDHQSTLDELYQKTLDARNDLGPYEDDFEALELGLNRAEYRLNEKIKRLNSQYDLSRIEIPRLPSGLAYDVESHISYEDEYPPPNSEMQFGSTVKVGDRPSFPTVQSPHPSSPQKPPSQGNSQVVDSGTLITMDDLPRFPLRDTERVILDLTAPELRANPSLNTKGGGSRLLEISLDLEQSIDDDLAGEPLLRESSLDSGDELVLRPHDLEDIETRSTLSDYLTDFSSTENRVSRWMLHKLRTSKLEVLELRRKLMESSGHVRDWPTLSLRSWDDDEAWPTSPGSSPFPSTHLRQPSPYPPVPDPALDAPERERIFGATMKSFQDHSPDQARRKRKRASGRFSRANTVPTILGSDRFL